MRAAVTFGCSFSRRAAVDLGRQLVNPIELPLDRAGQNEILDRDPPVQVVRDVRLGG